MKFKFKVTVHCSTVQCLSYTIIIVRIFESKQYSFIGLQNMLHQELKNQICNDVKAKYIHKFFSPSEIDVVKCHLT